MESRCQNLREICLYCTSVSVTAAAALVTGFSQTLRQFTVDNLNDVLRILTSLAPLSIREFR